MEAWVICLLSAVVCVLSWIFTVICVGVTKAGADAENAVVAIGGFLSTIICAICIPLSKLVFIVSGVVAILKALGVTFG